MKRILLFLLLVSLVSCGVKQSTNALNLGNYDQAIDIAINSLRGNKKCKRQTRLCIYS